MEHRTALTYQAAGVDSDQQDRAMPLLKQWVERTFAFRRGVGAVQLPLGYFANVLDLGNNVGLAVSADGVGTKALVAQMLERYDTIGIDCVAMNVNDVLCVGAEPVALLDYVAVETVKPGMLEALAKGLAKGAEMAGIAIPGGEIAQIQEMIRGVAPGRAFDLVGACVGIVPLDRVLAGKATRPGEAVIGLRSSGVHSNGLTHARRALFRDGWGPDTFSPGLGRTIGEELLEPTRIYVKEILDLLRAGLRVSALGHITSTGFLNLTRAEAPVGYVLDRLPEPQPIFELIRERGAVADEEMYFTYNMGVGFCVVVAAEDCSRALSILQGSGATAQIIGETIADPDKRVRIPSKRLIGRERFTRY